MLEIKYILPQILETKLLRHRVTQAEAARQIGVSKTVLNGWLSGSYPRDLIALARLAQFLKIPLYYLLFGKNDPITDFNIENKD